MKRKLSLAKETIRSLTTGQLRDVAGGTTATWPYCTTYDYTECEGCSNTCPPGPTGESECGSCQTWDTCSCNYSCEQCSQCDCISEGNSACTSELTC